jgi:hypothetical protein
VRAYNGWAAARAQGRERAYAAAHFVSGSTMNMIEGMRSQLLSELTVRISATHHLCSLLHGPHGFALVPTRMLISWYKVQSQHILWCAMPL